MVSFMETIWRRFEYGDFLMKMSAAKTFLTHSTSICEHIKFRAQCPFKVLKRCELELVVNRAEQNQSSIRVLPVTMS